MTAYLNNITPVLEGLRDLLTSALASEGRPVGRSLVAPGLEVAWDDCCDGQVAVRLISIYPTGNPYPALDSIQNCGVTMLGLEIGVSVMRCSPSLNDDGSAPSPGLLSANASDLTADAITTLGVLTTELPSILDPMFAKSVKVGAWTPAGPLGGCAGGEWTVRVGSN